MRTSFFTMHRKIVLTVVLAAFFIGSLFSVQWNKELLHAGGGTYVLQILKGLITPDLSKDVLLTSIDAAWITISYAVAGMSLAIIIAFVFGTLASGVIFPTAKASILLKTFFRGLLGFMRAIHELVWAWLFVASFGLHPISAILALAIPYGGILGRIFADFLNDVPEAPIKALLSSGATKLQSLFYGYLPMVTKHITSYTMYRFECSIRSSAIMSFVGIGGLGYQIQLSLDDLNYNQVWTYVYFLIAIVVLIDWWSSSLRGRLGE